MPLPPWALVCVVALALLTTGRIGCGRPDHPDQGVDTDLGAAP